MLNWLLTIDGNILLLIQDFIRHPLMSPLVRAITTLGNGGAIWILLTIIMLILPRTRKIGCMMFVALLGTLLVNNILLKNLVARIRPYEVLENLTILIPKPGEYSFPSGHSGSSFAVACVMFRQLPKRYGIPALILAALIGLSRLYVGVHYPSDVLFGAIDGIAIGLAAEVIVEKIGGKKNEKS